MLTMRGRESLGFKANASTQMKDVGFAFTQVDRWVSYDIPYVKLKKESCRATTKQKKNKKKL